MLIGKAGAAVTALCASTPDRIEVRGRDFCRDLLGRMSFVDYFYFLMTGSEPSDDQRFFLDLLLVAITEHGLTPTAQAARMTLAAAPDSLQGAVAAGILGCGTVVLGSAERCALVLSEASSRTAAGENPQAVVDDIVITMRMRGEKIPGFGHPIHHPLDPRTERILALVDERHAQGKHVELLRLMRGSVERSFGRPMPLNVSGPIGAILLDLGFPPLMVKAIPILARTAGLLAHLAEEQRNPIGFLLAHHAEEAIAYDPNF